MAADLRLSGAVLEELIAGFTGFGDRLSRACKDMRAGDGAVTGDDPLSGPVHGFAGSWGYGLTQLGQHGHDCARMLRQVGTAFDKLERQLTSELTARHQAGQPGGHG